MPYFISDLVGLIAATLLAPILYLLPGFGLARLIKPGLGRDLPSGAADAGLALILAIGLFPLLDSLLVRWTGFGGLILVHGALAIHGRSALPRIAWRATRPFLIAAALWWLACLWAFADIDWNGRLYQNFIIYDLVKHAAVTEAIAREGVLFRDPFFARDGHAGYYFYYYTWPATLRWLSGFTLSARMAFAGCAFWTGVAIPALAWRVMTGAGMIRPGRARQVALLAVALCFVTGLDLLIVTARWLTTGRVDIHIDVWNTEVVWFFRSAIWVPHHLSALIAGWCGLLLAAHGLDDSRSAGRGRVALAMAAVAFASMVGLSIWVAMALTPVLIGWGLLRLGRGDWRLAGAGVATLMLSMPLLIDIRAGRMDDTFPITVAVRAFMSLRSDESLTAQLLDVLLLPLNYGLEFGLFAMGALMALRLRPSAASAEAMTIRRLLMWSTIASFIVASFFRAALINNDLGWRAILFAQFAAMAETLYVAQSGASLQKHWRLAGLMALLGVLGNVYDLVAQRFARPSLVHTWAIAQNLDPAIDYDLRGAYGWADGALPPGATLQHNPAAQNRVFDFGLYGSHWPAVADHEAGLFGAGQHAVDARIGILAPIFQEHLDRPDILRRAGVAKADFLLFTAADPAWRTGLPFPCLYRTARVCISDARAKDRP